MRAIGILGGGNISETHLRAAQQVKGVKVEAICGQNREKVHKLAVMAGASAYEDLDDFLNHKPLDLVAIGSPSGLHASQGIAAARRGLHVLVEKPLDISTERADALIRECAKAKVQLGVFFQDRVAPQLRQVKERLDRGELGRLILASAHVKWYRPPEYYRDSKWRGTWVLDGGGALMNQGIHTVDLLLWLANCPVRQVFAKSGALLHSIETEDTVVATLEFENGALGTLEAATSAYPGQPRRVYLSGSEGTVSIEQDRLVSMELQGRDPDEGSANRLAENKNESSPVISDVSGHRRLLEDFLLANELGREPLCSGESGRRSVELVEAVYQSVRTGKPVALRGGAGGGGR